ncbi:MAG: outer membrane beta-barrel protein [Burkholderiales bacterium]
MKALLAGFAFLLAASPVMAADDMNKGSGWYIGGGGGPSSILNVCSGDPSAQSCDDQSVGWKVFLGKEIYKYTAIELQYADGGEATLVAAGDTGTLDINPQMASAFLKVEVPVAMEGRLGLFAKFGGGYYKTDYSPTGSYTGVTDYDDGIETAWGAGVTWRGWQHFSVRFEWENFNDVSVNGGDVNMGSFNLVFHF